MINRNAWSFVVEKLRLDGFFKKMKEFFKKSSKNVPEANLEEATSKGFFKDFGAYFTSTRVKVVAVVLSIPLIYYIIKDLFLSRKDSDLLDDESINLEPFDE